MNKPDVVAKLAERTGLSKNQTAKVVDEMLDIIVEGMLEEGGKVKFSGFGTFFTKVKKARVGRNPKTGTKVDVPERLTPAFSFFKTFKAVVAEKGA